MAKKPQISPVKDKALLPCPPLRTVRDSFPSHRSSLYKAKLTTRQPDYRTESIQLVLPFQTT